MPPTIAATKSIVCGSKKPRLTIAGPGQTPEIPQPIPKIAAPIRSVLSTASERRSAIVSPKERCLTRRHEPKGDKADADRAGHNERKRRIPIASNVEKSLHLARVRHAGDFEPQTKQSAKQKVHDQPHRDPLDLAAVVSPQGSV
jgi:hypothetical protein